jgi:succinyl-CoA synthetase beta subunit
MTIDDNALYRHPDFQERMQTRLKPLERKAREEGLSYVELDGDIGVIGNGAGLVMATLDMIKYCGGKPANFCDVGGGASAGKMAAAIRLALSNERVKVLLINILGGITKCDEVARGILEVKDAVCMKPVIVRMVGTNDEFGRAVLAKEGISSLDSMEEAAKMAVKKSFEVK